MRKVIMLLILQSAQTSSIQNSFLWPQRAIFFRQLPKHPFVFRCLPDDLVECISQQEVQKIGLGNHVLIHRFKGLQLSAYDPSSDGLPVVADELRDLGDIHHIGKTDHYLLVEIPDGSRIFR